MPKESDQNQDRQQFELSDPDGLLLFGRKGDRQLPRSVADAARLRPLDRSRQADSAATLPAILSRRIREDVVGLPMMIPAPMEILIVYMDVVFSC